MNDITTQDISVWFDSYVAENLTFLLITKLGLDKSLANMEKLVPVREVYKSKFCGLASFPDYSKDDAGKLLNVIDMTVVCTPDIFTKEMLITAKLQNRLNQML